MEQQQFKKRYGLITAICMVVGIVIGSGIFYKTEKILSITKGNALLGALGWIIGGLIMLFCACTFGILAQKYRKINGIVDYAEATCGKKYGFAMGWFVNYIYFPAMTGVLSMISSVYLLELIAPEASIAIVFNVGIAFLTLSYLMNYLSPKIAGYFQVSTTVIKLIPVVLLGVVGVIVGIFNGNIVSNMSVTAVNGSKTIFDVICATSFAYEGWIIATTINSELKNPKKDLPKALFIGALIVIAMYVIYYLGVLGGATNRQIIINGSMISFSNIFGTVAGVILRVFVVISCLGTLNGLTIGSIRGIYSMAVRNQGVKPEVLSQLNPKTNMPVVSSIVSYFVSFVWFVYFVFSAFSNILPKFLVFDSSELPIITVYAMYIPMFIAMMIKEKELSIFKRFILPSLAIVGSVTMVCAAIFAHKTEVIIYLIVFALIMFVGLYVEVMKNPSNEMVKEIYVDNENIEENQEVELNKSEEDKIIEEEKLEDKEIEEQATNQEMEQLLEEQISQEQQKDIEEVAKEQLEKVDAQEYVEESKETENLEEEQVAEDNLEKIEANEQKIQEQKQEKIEESEEKVVEEHLQESRDSIEGQLSEESEEEKNK